MNGTKNEKPRISFNFIDVLLILTAFAAALVLVFFIKNRQVVMSVAPNTAQIEYKLEFSPMREDFKNFVKIGDTVVSSDNGSVLGEVADVSYSKCIYTGYDSTTGKPVETQYPAMITMTVTVRSSAAEKSTGYIIGGNELILGKDISVRVPDFTGSGRLISLTDASGK